MPSMVTRPQATPEQVRAAITEIRAYHGHGCKSLQALPRRGGGGYAKQLIKAEAERLRQEDPATGWNATRLRKARQFADEEEGYSQKRLTELCQALRKGRPVFGVSQVGILVTLSWAEGREDLQRECIESNWSKAELELEVWRRVGPRRQGGRKRKVGGDPILALIQLNAMADTWRRWCAAAAGGDDGDEEDAPRVLKALPQAIGKHIKTVSDAMSALREAVGRKLAAARAERGQP
jgi:hypothetical protein